MRILSGIQPTGDKHLGNFIGAIRQYVSYQDDGDALYFIADLHALTVLPDRTRLKQETLSTAALLLAAGLEPERCTLFVQSHLGGLHGEGAWLLGCVAGHGQLSRMTQFKDKSARNEHISVGLFTYPVLQAADILLHDIDVVPVGEDQKQHLELARDIAQSFNSRFGDTFVVPEPRIPKVGARIMDLQEPTSKMSTSGGTEKGTVLVLDPPEVVVRKIKSAVTDSGSEVAIAEDKPGIANLLAIMSVATGRTADEIASEYRTAGYGAFKQAVAEATVEFLRPTRERHAEIMADRGELERILAAGAETAGAGAFRRLAKARKRMGLLPPARR